MCIDFSLDPLDNFELIHMIITHVKIFSNLKIVALNWGCNFIIKNFYFLIHCQWDKVINV